MKVFVKESGSDVLTVTYYPGMAEILVLDGWNDQEAAFNISIKDWRAMNVAVEAVHGGHHDKEC